MILAGLFSKISAILTFICLIWCFAIMVFALFRFIFNKIKDKQELKKDIKKEQSKQKKDVK